jgi:hypothetical protein
MKHDEKKLQEYLSRIRKLRTAVCAQFEAQIEELKAKKLAALVSFNAAHPTFEDGLIFSAVMRCKCGSGLCYAENEQTNCWDCHAVFSAQRKGEQPPAGEHTRYLFYMYDIKSETQPSAGGATTRSQCADLSSAAYVEVQ